MIFLFFRFKSAETHDYSQNIPTLLNINTLHILLVGSITSFGTEKCYMLKLSSDCI